MRIRKMKKIIILLIIMTMLQTQIVSLSNVAWAINMEMSGETTEGGLGTSATGTVEVEAEVTDEPTEEVLPGITGEVVDENLSVVPEEGEEVSEELTEEPTQEPTEEPTIEEQLPEEPEETPPPAQEESEEVPEVQEEVVEPKVELNIKSENSSIYKGYLYANATSNLRYETKYNTIEEVIIQGSKNGISKVVVKEDEDKIKMITATKMALLNDIYYKKTRVSVDEFKNILGESGIINIYDASGDFVGYIDAKSPEVNGYYEYDFIYYTNNVTYELSTPIADGTIQIINDKAIKEDSLYSREQIATFSTINVTANVEMIVGDMVLTAANEGDITLQETEAKIEMELDKTELSTEDENELTLTLTLKTDAERYELFKNPVIEIEMPSNINELSIEGVNLLYKNGLSLKNWEVVKNDSGNKVLRIEMDGAQSVYTPGIIQEGTTIVIYTKLTTNRLTANTSEALKLTYTNEDSVRQSYILEGKSAEEVVLNFIAKHGMLKGMTGQNDITQSIGNSYEEEVDRIEVKSGIGEQKVNIKGTVVNNFEKETTDVVIVGRIPFIGNKNGDGEALLSEFDTIMSSEITTSGNLTEIYYSEDGEATKDSVSWTQDTSDMSKYKSYKIVVKEGPLKKGEKVEFVYEVTIPENLGYNLRAYATYIVFYKLDNQELKGNCSLALVSEEKELEADDLENKEEVAELEIGTQVTQGGKVLKAEDSVFERQILKYTVVVTNPSKVPVKNIKLTGRAENTNLYYMQIEKLNYNPGNPEENTLLFRYVEDINSEKIFDELIIEQLNPGESRTFEYQAIVRNIEATTEDIFVYGITTVSADNIEERQVETIKNKVNSANVEVKLIWGATESLEEKDALTNEIFEFAIYAKNISGKDLKNVKLNIELPEELYFNMQTDAYGSEGLKRELTERGNGTLLTFTIDTMKAGESKEIFVPTRVKDVDYTIENIKVNLLAYVTLDDDENIYYSNDYSKTVWQNETKLEYEWTADNKAEILYDEDVVNYTLRLKNIGIVDVLANVKNIIPHGLVIQKITLIDENGQEQNVEFFENSKALSIDLNLASGKEVKLIINTKVDASLFERDQESIDNKVTVSGPKFEQIETEVIVHKIHNENVTVEIPEKPNNEMVDIERPPAEVPEDNEGFVDEDNEVENPNNPEEPNNPEQPTNPEKPDNTTPNDPENVINKDENEVKDEKTYMISGKIWLDRNKDGINNNEKAIDTTVVALYKTTDKGNITSKVAEVITNANGEYTFNKVANGTYVVIFYYDTELYNSTKYKVATARTNENSDAITKAVNLDGSSVLVGITDVINIQNAGCVNLDLGLVERNEFDLSLEKYVSSVTVTNSGGTKKYNYENKDNIKVEIKSKYFENSIVEITYKIRVKNDGEVNGYVNKIVDYVPEGMKFDNNKNPDWYYGDDGNLYYKGFVGKEIQAGASKEILLTLTKTLENGETVKLINGAEIAESTNSMGLNDIDSTPANKEQTEDDYSNATIIITISTGSEVKNVALIILITLIVAIIIYMVRLKFSKKVYR